jgi:hypothetical protein
MMFPLPHNMNYCYCILFCDFLWRRPLTFPFTNILIFFGGFAWTWKGKDAESAQGMPFKLKPLDIIIASAMVASSWTSYCVYSLPLCWCWQKFTVLGHNLTVWPSFLTFLLRPRVLLWSSGRPNPFWWRSGAVPDVQSQSNAPADPCQGHPDQRAHCGKTSGLSEMQQTKRYL